jgi:acetamidase/formamidase
MSPQSWEASLRRTSPRVALEAAQTAPPRENGGNQDIKDLARGSRVF